MCKHIFTCLVVFAIVFVSTNISHAAEVESDQETLISQISAIQSYIERTYGKKSATPLTPEELRDSIRGGAVWFTKAQEESGHFKYEYVPYEDSYRNDDNVVRQAGGLYILGEIIRRGDNDDFELSHTIEQAAEYFENTSREDTRNGESFRCITKTPSVARCPLGATSLALIGILGYVEFEPTKEREYTNLIEDYITYILSMQKPTGGFVDTYTIKSKTLSSAESAFSNGEALLALVRYYKLNPREDVKTGIDVAFEYLSTQPFDANLYLWIMAAVKDMQNVWPKEEYISYAKEFSLWRVDRAAYVNTSNRNFCAYAEGLASAFSVISNNLLVGEKVRLGDELHRLNRNHLALQITSDDTIRMVLKDGVIGLHTLPNLKKAVGGFLTSDLEPTQRIDFTQHCLGAYVQTLVDIEGESL